MEKKQPNNRFLTFAAVALITLAAALLRLWGIRWGLPDALHRFTYHPDEIFQVGAMLRLDPIRLQFDPGFYNYPSFYMNLGSVAMQTCRGYGVVIDDGTAYLIARLVVVGMAVVTIPVVYGAAAKLYGRAPALLAALIFAIIPLHVVHSHFATVDVPATLWVAAALLGAALILSKPTLKVAVFAGVMAGFAAATKYNAALSLVPVIVAHLLPEEDKSWRRKILDGRLWASIVAFAVGFIVATPGVLLWPGKFASGFFFELKHAAGGHGLVFAGKGPGWFDVMSNSLGYGLGVALLAVALGAIAYAVVKPSRSNWVMLSFLVPYYLVISFSQVRFARYAMPMLPPLAMLTGRMIIDIIWSLRKAQASVVLRWGWVILCAGVVAYTGIYAAALDRLFLPPDPREEALQWFRTNVKPGATVGLPTVPWFYSPPFAPGIVGTVGRENRYAMMSESPWPLVTNPETEWDPAVINRHRPDYVVMSDFEYEDVMRLRLPGARNFISDVRDGYVSAAVITKRISILGINFGPTEPLPHDLKYMSPTIRIYRRK